MDFGKPPLLFFQCTLKLHETLPKSFIFIIKQVMCVCMSHYLPSCLKSVWKAGSIIRTVLAWASYVPSFNTLSRNFGYFSRFWTNFNMLGIQMHILKLKNSLVILGKAIGLKKEPKAQKKRPKASKRGRRPPKALRKS